MMKGDKRVRDKIIEFDQMFDDKVDENMLLWLIKLNIIEVNDLRIDELKRIDKNYFNMDMVYLNRFNVKFKTYLLHGKLLEKIRLLMKIPFI
jgi:hypothetical protein